MKNQSSKSGRVRRKCFCCKCMFYPDARAGGRQRYCSKEGCRKASKKASQAAWLAKNPDHFRGGESTERVRAWRERNPGYWRRHKRSGVAQQDEITSYPFAVEEDTSVSRPVAQQEKRSGWDPLLIGVLGLITGSTQQDEIAKSLQKALSLSHEIGEVTVG